MKLHIKYSYIPEAVELLYNMTLKGKQSRHRSRLIRMLQEKFKEIGMEEQELLREYAELDEEGEPIINDQKAFNVKDVQGFQKAHQELFSEEYIIDGADHQEMLSTLKGILLDYDGEISGKQAEAFDYLCEQFEGMDEQ